MAVLSCLQPLLPKINNLLPRDAFLIVGASALITHLIWNRWEPTSLPMVGTFFILLPSVLSSVSVPHYGIMLGSGITFLTFFGTLFSSIVLYPLSPFHPLVRYPGPLLCKVSKLWMLSVVSSGKQHLYIQSLHERYGDAVRVGPNEVSIRSASCILPLMGSQGCPKGPMFAGRAFHPKIPALVGYRNAADHVRRRRPWNRAFNTTALKEYQPIIARRVSQLTEVLGKQKGVVDLEQWISFFTYDFMGDMAFGGGTEMMRDGDNDGLWRALRDGMRLSQMYENVPWLTYYIKDIPFVGKDSKQFRGMALGRTAERYKKGSTSKDLFYYLSNEDGAEKVSPPPAVVISDGVLALVAGSDTTASTLSNLFWCLMGHAEAYKRLQVEVDRYYPPGEDALNPVHHPNMVFLDAVINETLRLFPVVPSGSQRSPEAGKGGKLLGLYYLPEGNQARIHFWSVHRDPRNFSHPTAFFPDRWLIAEGLQESPDELVHNANAFIPFSFGPASCVGKNLALVEMRIVVCELMQKFKMRFADNYDPAEWERAMEDRFVVTLGHLPAILERRD